jgi:hypothetical protein
MSVVPVSIAAYEDSPEGSVIVFEFTLIFVMGRVQYETEPEGTD